MPQTASQVFVIILFIIPGFVFTRVLGLFIPLRIKQTTQLILDSLAMSCVNYALLSPLVWVITNENFSSKYPVWFLVLWFSILFLSPLFFAWIAIRFIDSPKLRGFRQTLSLTHPIPKAWDYFFREGKQCWVLATLRDGRMIAGLYGAKSFASSFPAEEDLYLEKLCKLSPEGKMEGLTPASEGFILRMENIEVLEFYSLEGENNG